MNKQLKVIRVIDDYTVVINAGSKDVVTDNDRFIIYYLDEENLYDPDTRELLGKLEIVRGIGRPSHIQDRITTLKSDEWTTVGSATRVIRKPTFIPFSSTEEVITPADKERKPFENPQVGDLVKPKK